MTEKQKTIKRMPKEERIEDIINNAISIIHSNGIHELTTRRLAETCGITEAAIFRHFKNKEEIIITMVKRIFKTSSFNHLDIEKPGSLKDFILEIFSLFNKKPKLTSIIFQEEIFREYPKLHSLFIEHREKREEHIKNFIEAGQKKGLFLKDIDALSCSRIIMGSIRMEILCWKQSEYKWSLMDRAEELSVTLWKLIENK